MNGSRMRRSQAGGPHQSDHEPFSGAHRHAHPLFGDLRSYDHEHRGDGGHGGISIADVATIAGPAGQIMAAYRGAVPRPAEEGLPLTAKLDKHDWAASWPAFMAQLRTPAGERQVMTAISNAGLGGLSERTGSGGGFLVPWRLAEQVFMYLTQAIVWPRAMRLEMGAYRLQLPYLDNGSQAGGAQGLGGISFSIQEPGAAIPASNPQFGAAALEAHKLAALVSPVPNELAADAERAFSDLFSRVVGIGLGWEVDDLLINGNGVGEPEGILNATAALPVTRANSGQPPVTADVVALAKKLHPASKASAVWLASEDVFDALLDLYLAVGSPATQAVTPPEWLVFKPKLGCWTLLGIPFFPGEHQPPAGTPGDLALADLSLLAVGVQQEMTIERSQQGATFPQDASAWKIRTRIDSRYMAPGTYTLANGKVVSPITVLS